MPVNIAGKKDIQQKFIQSLMATSNSLALSQLWLVKINKSELDALGTYLKSAIQIYEGSRWGINDVSRTTDTQWFVGDSLYMLAQGVMFPGDAINVTRSGVSQSGMLKGVMGENRVDLPEITITLLETNQSAADLLFRPWMILVGHKSLKNQNLRINIDLICYQKNNVLGDLLPRKIVTLYAAAPINVQNEEYNYTGDRVMTRPINFTYNTYSIESDIGAFTTSDKTEYYKLDDVKSRTFPVEVPVPKTDPSTSTDLNLLPDYNVPLQPTETFQTALDKVVNGLTDKTLGHTILPEDQKGSSKSGKTSLFGSIKDMAQGVNQTFNDVVGKADAVQSLTTQALRSIPGGAGLANKVDVFAQGVDSTIKKPVANVITTGNLALRGVESVIQLKQEISTPLGQPVGIIHTIKSTNKV